MKKLIFIFLLLPLMSMAQSQIDVMAGYKAVEVNYFLRTESLNYGLGISAVDSKLVEKRANNNDIFYDHDFTQSVTPSVFALVGGQFEEVSIVGKMGASYVKQNINGIYDTDKHLFLAVGIEIGYDITPELGFKGSFDNVNSFMAGLIINL